MLATCWNVPEGTEGSSVTLRFGISSLGDLRGPTTDYRYQREAQGNGGAYRKAATAILEQCLPVCPTEDFGATLTKAPCTCDW